MDLVKNPALLPLWQRIKDLASVHENQLDVARDDIGAYKLVKYRTKSQFEPFVAVFIQREHVSIYVVQVARDPSVLIGLPKILRDRQRGKGTFRFKTEDDPAISHLPALFESCLMAWVEEGFIQ